MVILYTPHLLKFDECAGWFDNGNFACNLLNMHEHWNIAIGLRAACMCVCMCACEFRFEIEIWVCAHSIQILSMRFYVQWTWNLEISPYNNHAYCLHTHSFGCVSTGIAAPKLHVLKISSIPKFSHTEQPEQMCAPLVKDVKRKRNKKRFLPTCAYGMHRQRKRHTYVLLENICRKLGFVVVIEKEVIASNVIATGLVAYAHSIDAYFRTINNCPLNVKCVSSDS